MGQTVRCSVDPTVSSRSLPGVTGGERLADEVSRIRNHGGGTGPRLQRRQPGHRDAQRLGRRLCENCKTADDIPREALLEEGFTEDQINSGLTIYKPVGCDQCDKGYKGRVGLFEVMEIDDEVRELILSGGSAYEVRQKALQNGMVSLRLSGLQKIRDGITTIEEVMRETVQ